MKMRQFELLTDFLGVSIAFGILVLGMVIY